MQTHTFYLARHAVKLESAILRYLDGAYTEFLSSGVEQLSVLKIFYARSI